MSQRNDLLAAIDEIQSIVRAGDIALSTTERSELVGSLTAVVQRLAVVPATEESYADRRVEELLIAVRAVGRHEFPVRVPVSDRWDAFDVLATGVNVVAEELEIALRERSQAIGFFGAAASWFERMFANVPFMITVVTVEAGPRFRVLMTNGSGFESINVPRHDAVGRTVEEIFGPAEGAVTSRHLREVVARGAITTYTRTFFVEERPVQFEVTGTPIFADGRCTHIVLLSRSVDTRAPIERLDELLTSISDRLPLAASRVGELLTPRETEVLSVMATGTLADRAIAAELGISPATARTHVRNIMAKADVHDRRDLLGLAVSLTS
jgi:DNA-binding CsgD family transcriptional regulator